MNGQKQYMQLTILWLGLLASPLLLLVMIFVFDKLQLIEPVFPDLGNAIFTAGLISIAVPLLMLKSYRRLNRSLNDAVMTGGHDTGRIVAQLSTYLVLGSVAAELPAIFGLVYYLLTGELKRTIILVLVATVIAWFYKPETPRGL